MSRASSNTSKFRVSELTVRRENGDKDTLYLCTGCAESTADFLTILRRRRYNTTCDRCGKSAGSVALDQRLTRGW